MLHDVGMLGIAPGLLEKEEPLDKEEWANIRLHPGIGFWLVSAIPGFEALGESILHHHERWDGSGYPDGLEGEAIPLCSRIVKIADSFDAFFGDCPRMATLTARDIICSFRRESGRMFDPELVHAFFDLALN